MTPPGLNTSWAIEFTGPDLQCNKLDHATVTRVRDSIIEVYRKCPWAHTTHAIPAYQYMSWLRHPSQSEMPYIAPSKNASLDFVKGQNPASTLFIALTPNLTQTDTCYGGISPDDIGEDMMRCEFINSTYHVSFNYTSGVQKTHITTVPDVHGPITTLSVFEGPTVECAHQEYPTSFECQFCDWLDFPFRDLSYQTVADAFIQNVFGHISLDAGGVIEPIVRSKSLKATS